MNFDLQTKLPENRIIQLLNEQQIKPDLFSDGGILRFEGQTITIKPHETANYRCLFNEAPLSGSVPTCFSAGILGVLAGMLGTIQVAEAV